MFITYNMKKMILALIVIFGFTITVAAQERKQLKNR